MANPFDVRVPSINPLAQLMGGYQFASGIGKDRQLSAARQQAAQSIAQGGDPRAALAALIGAGDVQGANALANFGNQSFDQSYKTGMLDVARQNANRQDVPPAVATVRAAGMDPTSPEGRKALFPRTDTPISATDKKAIFEAEDSVPQLQGTLEALQRAQDLNSKTFSGFGASTRAAVGSNLPDALVPDFIADKKTADATTEWQKIMAPEALQTMANTLKGATTDFELRKFIEMLGDPATPPKVREGVIQRLQTLAERKMQINQTRLKDLRGGDYFKPGGGGTGQPAQPASRGGAPVKVNSPAERDALPPGTSYIAPDGSLRTKQ